MPSNFFQEKQARFLFVFLSGDLCQYLGKRQLQQPTVAYRVLLRKARMCLEIRGRAFPQHALNCFRTEARFASGFAHVFFKIAR